jgi:hypothetical protein
MARYELGIYGVFIPRIPLVRSLWLRTPVEIAFSIFMYDLTNSPERLSMLEDGSVRTDSWATPSSVCKPCSCAVGDAGNLSRQDGLHLDE